MFGKKPKTPLEPIIPEPVQSEGRSSTVEPQAPEPVNTPASRQTISETEESHMIESDLTASVSRNTIFTGNISSQDNVEIFGEVEGSVTSAAVVKIHGKVNGDVTCGVLIASNATVVGNIICEKSAVFGNDTHINGNVSATVVTVSGQINGNLNASESVSVSSTGAIYGDIATPEIEVSKGAIVFGSVVMEQPPAPVEDTAVQPDEASPAPLSANADAVLAPEVLEALEAAEAPKSADALDSEDDSLGPWSAEHKQKGPNPFSLEHEA